MKGGVWTEAMWEQSAEEDVGRKWDEVEGGWKKLHNEKLRRV
jgi:hypothetical protein